MEAAPLDALGECALAGGLFGCFEGPELVAVVAALGGGPAPRLLSVSSTDVEGSTAVTVVLEGAGGRRVAGAAIVAAGHAFAVGRATWSALHG